MLRIAALWKEKTVTPANIATVLKTTKCIAIMKRKEATSVKMEQEEINNVLELAYSKLMESKTEFGNVWLLTDFESMEWWLRGFCSAGDKKSLAVLVENIEGFLNSKN